MSPFSSQLASHPKSCSLSHRIQEEIDKMDLPAKLCHHTSFTSFVGCVGAAIFHRISAQFTEPFSAQMRSLPLLGMIACHQHLVYLMRPTARQPHSKFCSEEGRKEDLLIPGSQQG